jgi:hypothetical protein
MSYNRTGRWSTDENDALLSFKDYLVTKSYPNWKKVSKSLRSEFGVYRTPKQIRRRWLYYLSRQSWTTEEKKELERLVKKFGPRWNFIIENFFDKTKTADNVRYEWAKIERNNRKAKSRKLNSNGGLINDMKKVDLPFVNPDHQWFLPTGKEFWFSYSCETTDFKRWDILQPQIYDDFNISDDPFKDVFAGMTLHDFMTAK